MEKRHMLLCLEQCPKCDQTKELLKDRKDVFVVSFPHDMKNWTELQKTFAEKFNILEDLMKTAPIFVTAEGEKLIGYLRIRKWVEDGNKRKDKEVH